MSMEPCWAWIGDAHLWKVVEKTEQPSAVEVMADKGLVLADYAGPVGATYRRPVIVTYRCAKCGAEKVQRV